MLTTAAIMVRATPKESARMGSSGSGGSWRMLLSLSLCIFVLLCAFQNAAAVDVTAKAKAKAKAKIKAKTSLGLEGRLRLRAQARVNVNVENSPSFTNTLSELDTSAGIECPYPPCDALGKDLNERAHAVGIGAAQV